MTTEQKKEIYAALFEFDQAVVSATPSRYQAREGGPGGMALHERLQALLRVLRQDIEQEVVR